MQIGINAEPEFKGEIETLEDLMAVEELIDTLDNCPELPMGSAALMAKARVFIDTHPELLDTPWLRTGGTFHELIKKLRNQRDDELAKESMAPVLVPYSPHAARGTFNFRTSMYNDNDRDKAA